MEEKKIYSLHIPIDIARCNELTAGAKLLYGEIASICEREVCCMNRSFYFAKLYGVRRETISVWIDSLCKKRFIKRIIRRRYIRFIFLPTVDKNALKNIIGGVLRNSNTVLENSKDIHKVYIASKSCSNNTTSLDDDGFDFDADDMKKWLDNCGVT